MVEEAGGRIERFYFCPHSPDAGCFCRKPKIGMFLEAQKDFGIDLKNTFYVGDKQTDVLAARGAGCKSILLGKDVFRCEISPDFETKTFYDAVSVILGEKLHEKDNYVYK
jgi:histidinol phosphatase-like enzyme